MNWTQPRKSHKQQQAMLSGTKKISTTCLNTPQLKYHSKVNEQQKINDLSCRYHFNIMDHICLSCRKSICLRCAITYCQDHVIKPQKQLIPVLIYDMENIIIKQKLQQIQVKLQQSTNRQVYFEMKSKRIVQKIEQDFNDLIHKINKKKSSIIYHIQQEFNGFIHQYQTYDNLLKDKYNWIISLTSQDCIINQPYQQEQIKYKKQFNNKFNNKFNKQRQVISINKNKITIQSIDLLTTKIKEEQQIVQIQKRLNKLMVGKQKIKFEKMWCQQRLQKVLYQIQNINNNLVSITAFTVNKSEKKKRVLTQSADNPKVHHKSPIIKIKVDKNYQSKYNSGRKHQKNQVY